MQYYVYTASDEAGKVLYVGSGKGNRIDHVNSGKSHNKGLNEFTITVGKLTVVKVAEGMSKSTSLRCEQDYIDLYSPCFNLYAAVGNSAVQANPLAVDISVIPSSFQDFTFDIDSTEYLCDYEMAIADHERRILQDVAQMNKAYQQC